MGLGQRRLRERRRRRRRLRRRRAGLRGRARRASGTAAEPSSGPSSPAAPPEGQGAAPAPKNRCDDVREDQRATLRFTYTFQHYTFDKSQVPAKPFHERNSTYPVGSMKLGAATCRTHKKWRILKPVSVSWESVGVDVTPKLEPIGDGWSKGWGIGVKQARVPRTSPWPVLDVPMMRCTKGSLLAGVKELLGVPIPKLNFFWALVAWGASKAIPDDAVKCQQPARYRVELHADQRGKLYVIAPMSDFDPYTDETHIPDPGRPSTVEVQRIKADEARIS
jgi:hypothetical protein